jgi:hypothetical protein
MYIFVLYTYTNLKTCGNNIDSKIYLTRKAPCSIHYCHMCDSLRSYRLHTKEKYGGDNDDDNNNDNDSDDNNDNVDDNNDDDSDDDDDDDNDGKRKKELEREKI